MKRLLFIAKDRTKEALHQCFDELGQERSSLLKYVCSDMWEGYINVIAERAPQALNILDRFHIVQNLNKALNKVRASEAKRLKQEGYEDVLTHTKYYFLKNEKKFNGKAGN